MGAGDVGGIELIFGTGGGGCGTGVVGLLPGVLRPGVLGSSIFLFAIFFQEIKID